MIVYLRDAKYRSGADATSFSRSERDIVADCVPGTAVNHRCRCSCVNPTIEHFNNRRCPRRRESDAFNHGIPYGKEITRCC